MFNAKQNEPLSALTHFVGALLSIAALVLLIIQATRYGEATHIVTYTIFGVSMLVLYTMSTLYHVVCTTKIGRKKVFRILDHSAVFLLIAGTYTPVALTMLPSGWGWTIFGLIWAIAVFGIVIKATQIPVPIWASVTLYLLMGWLILIAAVPLFAVLDHETFFWLVSGGVFYTVGALFFAIDTFIPRTKWFGMHEIFHLCVMLGSFSHFWMLFQYGVYL